MSCCSMIAQIMGRCSLLHQQHRSLRAAPSAECTKRKWAKNWTEVFFFFPHCPLVLNFKIKCVCKQYVSLVIFMVVCSSKILSVPCFEAFDAARRLHKRIHFNLLWTEATFKKNLFWTKVVKKSKVKYNKTDVCVQVAAPRILCPCWQCCKSVSRTILHQHWHLHQF